MAVQPSGCLERGLVVTTTDSQIYDSVKGDLIRYATALVGPSFAADLVSTVVLRVLSKQSLSDLREPRPYLFRSVLNEARSVGRHSNREVSMSIHEAVYDSPNLHPEILEAVGQLPVRQRAATYLVYWSGHSIAEAADLMGVGNGTVKRYLSLARASLREVLHADA